MKRFYALVIALLVLSGSTLAQEPASWPPDTSIFAPGVQVITSQVIEPELGKNLTWVDFNDFPVPLPEQYQWIYSEALPIPAVTPDDGQRFFLILRTEGMPDTEALVVLYDTTIREFEELGQIMIREGTGFMSTRGWRNTGDILPIVTFDRGENMDRINESFAIIGLTDYSIHQTEPGLYARFNQQLLSIETFIPREDGTCQWQLYSLANRTTTVYEYGTWCYLEAGDRYGNGYYRNVADDKSDAAVVRFNPLTGEWVGLYRGEVEKVVWVDADERFAAFILDDNGAVDLPPDQPCNRVDLPGAKLAIVDLNREVTYDFPAERAGNACTWLPQVYSITPEWVQLVMHITGTTPNTLVRLTSNGIVSKPIIGALSQTIGTRWAVQYQRSQQDVTQWISQVSLYDLETSDGVPLLNIDTPDYAVVLSSIYALTPTTIQLEIEARDGAIARYMLYLPILSSPLTP